MFRKLPTRCDSAYADCCTLDWDKIEKMAAECLPGAPKTTKERVDAVIGMALACLLWIGEYFS